MHTLRTWTRRRFLIGALALSLLFMQGLGQLHALLHAGLLQNVAVSTLTAGGDSVDPHASPAADDGVGSSANSSANGGVDGSADDSNRLFDAHHSCAAFSALTLAFALAVSGLAALLLARSRAPAQAPRVLRRHVTPIRRFLSRAPPSFLIA